MNTKRHRELLRKHFAAQARVHPKTVRYRHAENVAPMMGLAQPLRTDRLLDVACGWGFVPLEFRPHVASATGVDLVPEMVDLARKVARERGAGDIRYVLGDAEALDFPRGSFDIVTCRLTFHHFGRPLRALSEMRRVLAPGGRIVLYDYLASADRRRAKRHNGIERMRDPCHVKIYSVREFRSFFGRGGLKEQGRVVTLMKRDFNPWMDFVDADAERRSKVRRLLEESMEGNAAGLGPRLREGRLVFTHTCVAWLLGAGRA